MKPVGKFLLDNKPRINIKDKCAIDLYHKMFTPDVEMQQLAVLTQGRHTLYCYDDKAVLSMVPGGG